MKVIKLKYVSGYYTLYNFHPDITIIIIDGCNDIVYYNNSEYHNENGPAIIHCGYNSWAYYYKCKYYGDDYEFTKKSWKNKIKREEKLKMFK